MRCVRVCKDMRSNVQLWERVVDELHAEESLGAEYRTTLLIHSAREGNVARVKETLGRGARVDARDSVGCSALFWASCFGRLAVVHELLNLGAAINAPNARGLTALMQAARDDYTLVVLELVGRGADVNARDSDGWTPLAWAAYGGGVDAVATLVRAGADVNAKNRDGDSVLTSLGRHMAAASVRLTVMVAERMNDTPEFAEIIALAARRRAVIELLEAAGAR